MATEPEEVPETVSAHLELKILGQPIHWDVEMPAGPVPLQAMLPALHVLTDGVAGVMSGISNASGHPVSCKKGCGACCRQLVPVAEVEARAIRDLVNDLPEPRRSVIRERFAEARRRLEESGMYQTLLERGGWDRDERRKVAIDYFALKIPCPFLEDESCSIYRERPVICRQYMVVTPPEECAHPQFGTLMGVPIPGNLSSIPASFDPIPAGETQYRWVPLSLALEWADSHPDELPPRPAPEFFTSIIEQFTGMKLTSPSATTPASTAQEGLGSPGSEEKESL